MTVRILVQRQDLDQGLLAEIVADECASVGINGLVSWSGDVILAAAEPAGPVDALILVTTPEQPDIVSLTAAGALRPIRVDVGTRRPDHSPGLQLHIQGRGIDGVRWALRAVYHRARHTVQALRYGPDPEQYGELRLPTENLRRRCPAVVLVHGGFWRSRWQLDLMDALAVDLAQRGLASWNVEYRRPDRHGWAATVADVHAAIDHLSALAERFDLDVGRVAFVGHSAGGQLAAAAAADRCDTGGGRGSAVTSRPVGGQLLRPALLVQLAGLVDLTQTHRRDLGYGAVPAALGGRPEQCPDVYEQASPLLRVPIGVPQLVVIGTSDSPDLREMSRRYTAAASQAGDEVDLIEDQGDHFTIIDARSPIWSRAAVRVVHALTR